MFTAIILISAFTASITSAVTVSELSDTVVRPSDLPRVRVGAVSGTSSERYLLRHGIAFKKFAAPLDALEALDRHELGAVVHDAPILRFLIKERFDGQLKVLPGLPGAAVLRDCASAGSALRKPLNEALLDTISGPDWELTMARYLSTTK